MSRIFALKVPKRHEREPKNARVIRNPGRSEVRQGDNTPRAACATGAMRIACEKKDDVEQL